MRQIERSQERGQEARGYKEMEEKEMHRARCWLDNHQDREILSHSLRLSSKLLRASTEEVSYLAAEQTPALVLGCAGF